MKTLSIRINYFILSLLLSLQVYSQSIEWARYFTSTSSTTCVQSGNTVKLDGAGNIHVAGYLCETDGSGSDYGYLKYSANGDLTCSSTYSGSGAGNDEVQSLALDNQNNAYLTGFCYGQSTNFDFATIKYNSGCNSVFTNFYNEYCASTNDGDKLWDESSIDTAYGIVTDNNNNVYVSGDSYCGGIRTIKLIKYNQNGTALWTEYITGGIFASMTIDNNNNIYICATVVDFSWGTYFTAKYDSDGNLIWSRLFRNSDKHHKAIDIAVDANYNVYVTGKENLYTIGNDSKFLTIKYDANGNYGWGMTAQNRNYCDPVDITVNSGYIYVTGNFISTPTDGLVCTIKYDASGNEIWKVSNYINDGLSVASLCVDYPGNCYIACNSSSGYTILKLSYNNGQIVWQANYSSGENIDIPESIAIDGNSNLYVTGRSRIDGIFKMLTIKISQSDGDYYKSNENVRTDMPSKFSLYQNYPNPFNPSTEISFELADNSSVSVKVYNALGELVNTLIDNEFKQKGIYSLNYDGTNLPSGIYIYTLETKDIKLSKKMALIK